MWLINQLGPFLVSLSDPSLNGFKSLSPMGNPINTFLGLRLEFLNDFWLEFSSTSRERERES